MAAQKIIVKAKAEGGFYRAGLHFTREGTELDTGKLSKDALEAIRNEPNLVVIEPEEAAATPAGDLCYLVLKPFEFNGAKIEPAVDGAPVLIQLSAEDAEKLAAEGCISTADGDVSLPPDADKKPAGKAKAAK